MRVKMLLILCVAVLAAFDTTHAACSSAEASSGGDDPPDVSICPENSQYQECGASCPDTCDNYQDSSKVCTADCVDGCRCNSGYVLGPDQTCITPDQCPASVQSAPGSCPRNQHWDECGNSCTKTCDNYRDKNNACSQQCSPGCKCNKGFVLNGDECVRPRQCPRAYDPAPAQSAPGSCPRNQHWDDCGNTCTRTCDNYRDEAYACSQQCSPGCSCDKGFVLNGDDCVSPDQCPRAYDDGSVQSAPGSCPRNQHWDECGNSCTKTCDNYRDGNNACAQQCSPGCKCNKGFVLNGDKCVRPRQCPRAYDPAPVQSAPGSCPRNQHWDECGNTCTRTCDNYRDEAYACSQQCSPGCSCDNGFVLNGDDCVSPDQCPRAYDDAPPQSGSVDRAPGSCPRNQHWDECGNSCTRTCENYRYESYACSQQCAPGCRCDKGFVLNGDKCVRPRQCPRAYDEACPMNEQYNSCGSKCPVTCQNLRGGAPDSCSTECVAGCECSDGFVRDTRSNRCVRPRDCPSSAPAQSGSVDSAPGSCPRNQHWDECGNSCTRTCDNYRDGAYACSQQCSPGCKCNKGFVLDGDDCVSPRQCPRAYGPAPPPRDPEPAQSQGPVVMYCPINQHYENCGTACPDTCDNYNDNNRVCTRECKAGCQCNRGLVLSRGGQCVPPNQCPQSSGTGVSNGGTAYCGYNQHYESCGTTCPQTCANYYDPPSGCATVCRSGCQCNDGYILDPNGNCVAPSQCPGNNNPVCPMNERYNSCGSKCPTTCQNLRGGAPDSCSTECVAGCECANGFVRDTRSNRCVRPKDCPNSGNAQCPPNEYYSTCVNQCNNCDQRGNCQYYCYYGCDCIQGYYRNANGTCIPAASCPNSCGQNEYYSSCKIPCNDCRTRGKCRYYCYYGCDCIQGYYRDASGKCVQASSCPNNCPKNSVYTDCRNPCNDCYNRGQCGTYNCYYGCNCVNGYYEDANGNCIPANQCPANNG